MLAILFLACPKREYVLSELKTAMSCSGFMHFVAHDWRRVKSLSDHPSYREHTREAAKTWNSLSNLQQAYWDSMSASTDACKERVKWKSMSEAEKKEVDCQRCREKCSDLRGAAEAMLRKADRLEHRAEHGKRPLSPYMVFAQRHRHEYSGNPVQQARALGERWRAMSSEEKAEYETPEYKKWRAEHGGSGISAKLKRKKKSDSV
jgi:predicted Fe-S protein YdhL (DUF1289 family)